MERHASLSSDKECNLRAIHEALGASPPHSSDDESTVRERTRNTLKRVRDEEKDSANELFVRLKKVTDDETATRENLEKTLNCNVCHERPSDVLVRRCGHVSVCHVCIEQHYDTHGDQLGCLDAINATRRRVGTTRSA